MNLRGVSVFVAPAWRRGAWPGVLSATSMCAVAAELLLPAALGRTAVAALGTDGAGDARPWLAGSIALLAVLMCCELLADLTAGSAAGAAAGRLRHRPMRHIVGIVLAAGGFALGYGRLGPAELLEASQYAVLAVGPGGLAALLGRR
jgi:hypothetical protein